MPTQLQEDFAKFADTQNNAASLARMAKGLGISPDKPAMPKEMYAIIQLLHDKIADITLREILETNIGQILQHQGEPEISMLDIVTLGLTEPEQIKRYLRNYGVDLDKSDDLAYATEVMAEAIEYFNKHIKENETNELSTLTQAGIYHLFQTAAGKGKRMMTPYACALLRIMAIIDFINKNPLLSILPREKEPGTPNKGHVLEALRAKLSSRIKREGKKNIFYSTGGEAGDTGIELVRVELRIKERDRVITKLLHKPGNREEAVLDHIGARITTRTSQEAIRIIHEMFFHPRNAIFPDTNIRVGKSKNKVINLDVLRSATQGDPEAIENFMTAIAEETIDHEELTTIEDVPNQHNTHSSRKYRAIHITVDIPIKIDHGTILFPIELQFLDIKSRITNEQEAPHEGYVERQMKSVRERLLNNNLSSEFTKRRKDKKATASPS